MLLKYLSAFVSILVVAQLVASDGEINYEPLFEACTSRLKDIETVDQMRQFIQLLRKYRENHVNSYSKSMKRCMAEFDSLSDIENVIKVETVTDVCHPDRVKSIVDYYNQHLTGTQLLDGKKKRLARKFMRRYGLQVSLICRENLINNIEDANQQFTAEDFYQVFPWRNPLIVSKLEKSGNETEKMDAAQAIQTANQLFGNINNIDTAVMLIRTFTTVSPAEFSAAEELLNDIGVEKTAAMRETCQRMSKYYNGAIISIVSMASLGYDWNGYKLNATIPEEKVKVVSDWLSASIMCSIILKLAPVTDEPITDYHAFDRNILDANKPFETKKFVNQFAVTNTQKFVNKWGVKFGFVLQKLVNSQMSKSGKNHKLTKTLMKLSKSIQKMTGDSVSKDEGKDLLQVAGWFLGILVVAAVIIGLVCAING